MLLIGSLVACGGGGNGAVIAPTNRSPGGIWQGMITSGGATQDFFGMIAEDGRFHFFSSPDGVQYFGTLSVTGSQLSAPFTGVPFEGTTFADGSIKGNGTLTGTIQERSQITISASFTTANNTAATATATLQFSPDYNVNSSLATIAGNFTNAVTPLTDTLTITSAGVLTYDDTNVTGCTAMGTVSIIDARFDLYAVEFTYAGCTGAVSARNGVHFAGLATIKKALSSAALVFEMNGIRQGDPVALLLPFQST
jgi:hypothetical protein